MVEFTGEQMEVVKGLVNACENFADQMFHVMQNHGLNKVNGCKLTIDIDPSLEFCTKTIEFGKENSNAGYIQLSKAFKGGFYQPFGLNSHEYEEMFDVVRVAKEQLEREEQIRSGKHEKKELPPDGMWI